MGSKSAFLFALIASVICYAVSQDNFEFRGADLSDRRLSNMPRENSNNLASQWLEHYYRPSKHEMNIYHTPLNTYQLQSDDEMRWLMDDIISQQQQHETRDSGWGPYSHKVLTPDLNILKAMSLLNGKFGEDDTGSDSEYSDLYGGAPFLVGSDKTRQDFEDTVGNILFPGNNERDKTIVLPQPNTEESIIKKIARSKFPSTESVKETLIPSSSTAAHSSEDVPSTTMSTLTTGKSSDSLMPPVSLGKGQKEYAMLRPPSEASKQFDKWAESFQEPDTNSEVANGQLTWGVNAGFLEDSLTDELNKLKVSKRN